MTWCNTGVEDISFLVARRLSIQCVCYHVPEQTCLQDQSHRWSQSTSLISPRMETTILIQLGILVFIWTATSSQTVGPLNSKDCGIYSMPNRVTGYTSRYSNVYARGLMPTCNSNNLLTFTAVPSYSNSIPNSITLFVTSTSFSSKRSLTEWMAGVPIDLIAFVSLANSFHSTCPAPRFGPN